MYDVKQICNKKTFIKEIEYLKEEKRGSSPLSPFTRHPGLPAGSQTFEKV
jgi:hypothetical protein